MVQANGSSDGGLAALGGTAVVDVSLPGWPLCLVSAAFAAATGAQLLSSRSLFDIYVGGLWSSYVRVECSHTQSM